MRVARSLGYCVSVSETKASVGEQRRGHLDGGEDRSLLGSRGPRPRALADAEDALDATSWCSPSCVT